MFCLHFWVIRMSSRGTFVLRRLGSVAFKLFAAIDLYSVNCGRMAAKRSAERTAEFENIGRNVVSRKAVRLKLDQLYLWLWPWNVTTSWVPVSLFHVWSHFLPVYSATINLEIDIIMAWLKTKFALWLEWAWLWCFNALGNWVLLLSCDNFLIGTANFLASEVTILHAT